MKGYVILMLSILCSIELFGFQGGDTHAVEHYAEAGFLVNADAIRRDNSLAYMKVYADALERLKETDVEKYREVKKQYKAAKYLFRKYRYLARETERKIALLQENSSDLIQWLNQMQEASQGKVFAYIGSKVRFSSKESLGDTYIRYEKAALAMKLEAEQGLLLLAPRNNAVKITLATDASLPDCRHELGHYAYIVIEPDTYYEFLIHTENSHQGDGHVHDDPSGLMAELFETLD